MHGCARREVRERNPGASVRRVFIIATSPLADVLYYRYDCNETNAQRWLITRGNTKVQLAGTNFCLDAGSSKDMQALSATLWLLTSWSRTCKRRWLEDLAMLREPRRSSMELQRRRPNHPSWNWLARLFWHALHWVADRHTVYLDQCVDLTNGSTANSNQLQTWKSYAGNNNQVWTV